jgi:crotonobetainyl-CoA:carnitine CoA-transferase CaiB-like acyl-CoA transferase
MQAAGGGRPDRPFQPLAGVRVLELAQNLAGPYCGQILADLGADVVKVERPGGGDAAREWGPPFVAGAGSIFAVSNRGKRSIELDVTTAHGRSALQALIGRSDVLIEAFRPGTFAAMGYDYETVRTWNPRLLYCSVLAYGEAGPLRDLPGYDPLMQAHGGLMSITGDPTAGRRGWARPWWTWARACGWPSRYWRRSATWRRRGRVPASASRCSTPR